MGKDKMNLGEKGELLAREYLGRKGFVILACNFQCRYGEIDIIAQNDGELVFVEVKTRRSSSFGNIFEQVSESKKQCLIKTMNVFLETQKDSWLSWRFDYIGILAIGSINSNRQYKIHHLKNVLDVESSE